MEKKNKRALDRYDSDDYWKKFYKRSHFGYIDQDISMIFRSLNILKNKTMYMLDNRISSVMMYSEIYAFGKYLKSIIYKIYRYDIDLTEWAGLDPYLKKACDLIDEMISPFQAQPKFEDIDFKNARNIVGNYDRDYNGFKMATDRNYEIKCMPN